MPSLVVCFHNLSRKLAIPDGFVKVLSIERGLAVSNTCPFDHGMHDLVMLDLHIFIIEMPFAQLEVAIAKQARVLDLLFINHFFKLRNCLLLFHRVVIVFI
jgi:hypothetical protein